MVDDLHLDSAASFEAAVDTISGNKKVQYTKQMDGTPGSENVQTINASGEAKVIGPVTDTELRATPIDVDTGLTQPLTDTQLRALAVGVSMATASQADGHSASIGATTDADTALTVIGRLKKLVTELLGLRTQLPSALSAGGNLKVSLAESTATQAVSGTVSVSALPGTTLAGQTANTTDMDTGAGVVSVPMLGIALPANGGPVPGGTSTAPLRTDPTGATTQPVSGTFWPTTQPISAASLPLPTNAAQDGTDITSPTAMPAGGSGMRGWLSAIWTKMNGTLAVSQKAATTTSGSLQTAAGATGNGALLSVDGMSAVILTVSGTFVGTVTFEGTEDGSTFAALNAVQLGTNTIASTATAPGLFELPVAGLVSVRARISAWTSGAITVTGHAAPVTWSPKVVTANVAAKATLWQNAPVSRGNVLTTELNSLANGAYSALGTAIDNTTNSDQYGALDIVLASLTPTAGATLSIYLCQSLDGTNYDDAPSSTNPATHLLVATVYLSTATGAKRVMTPWFYMPPGKCKFVLLNSSGVAHAASGNTATLYTNNDEAQ